MKNRLPEFRFWHIARQVMYRVAILDVETETMCFYPPNGEKSTLDEWNDLSYSDQQDLSEGVLMQFTGMLDESGAKVYEGDVVRYDYDGEFGDDPYSTYYIVIFHHGAFCAQHVDDIGKDLDDCDLAYFCHENVPNSVETLTGNMYQHPELLQLTGVRAYHEHKTLEANEEPAL